MNNMNVQNTNSQTPADILKALGGELESLTPEVRKAAAYVLENPNDVGVSSIREIAQGAKVKPNTFMRMARTVGFDGYEDFRESFREEIRRGGSSFPDRARWLQSLAKGGKLATLYAGMAASAIRNIEETFASTNDKELNRAAKAIVCAKRAYVLGVGVNHNNAGNFTYLANMALDNLLSIPKQGSTATDDLARATKGDVLIAMTCKPYRSEVVTAVELARTQNVCTIAISDSPASPIVIGADHAFIVQADTPQFFPSSVSTIALLETLMAFVIADAKPGVIANIENFHARRHQLGIYVQDK